MTIDSRAADLQGQDLHPRSMRLAQGIDAIRLLFSPGQPVRKFALRLDRSMRPNVAADGPQYCARSWLSRHLPAVASKRSTFAFSAL